jgi:hypothetical protein
MKRLNFGKSSTLPSELVEAREVFAIVGLAGLAICAIAWIAMFFIGNRWPIGATGFYKGYLFAWIFCTGISLGAMAAVMIHHLTGGNWGYFVQRFGEAAANVLPLMFVLFIPILFGLRRLYPWADPNDHHAVVVHRRDYMNPAFFSCRFVVYFALWISIAWLLRTLSLSHDRTASKRTEDQLRRVSAAGLVIYFVSMFLASVDWIMSLQPDWWSTVFPFIMCMGQCVCGMSVLIIMLEIMAGRTPFVERIKPKYFNDLATLLITSVILWAYMSFSQLLVTWMGNLQGEITWYVPRSHGPWRVMAALLIFLGFLAPFVLLLQRGVKKHGHVLACVCVGLLIMQLLDLYWWIAPAGNDPYPEMHWFNVLMSVIALIGIGGAWIAAFLWMVDGPPLMPAGDTVPREVIAPNTVNPESRISEHDRQPAAQPGIA